MHLWGESNHQRHAVCLEGHRPGSAALFFPAALRNSPGCSVAEAASARKGPAGVTVTVLHEALWSWGICSLIHRTSNTVNAVPSAPFRESRGQDLQGEQRDNERTGFVLCSIWFPSGTIGTVLASYSIENYPLHAAARVKQSPSATWDTPDRISRAKCCLVEGKTTIF